MNQQNLTIYDFIVDVIPGAVAILLAVSVLPSKYLEDLSFSNLSLGSSILIIVLGYLIGHLIQAIASPVDRWVYFKHNDKYPFEAALEEVEDADNESVEKRFAKHVEGFFEDDGANTLKLNESDIFQLTQSYLWNHDIGRARRFQILYTFLRSIWVTLAIGAGVHLIAAVASYLCVYQLIWTATQSAIIILGLVVGAIISYKRRVKYHIQMANSLIFDFYANVTSNRDEE
jgi:hypothetical protein